MDASDQLNEIAKRMNDKYNTLPPARPDRITVRGQPADIGESDFVGIPDSAEPAVAAYIDGGDAVIHRSPAFTATLNRLSCSAFRGSARADPPAPQRVQFLSLMHNVPRGGRTERKFEVFAAADQHECVPGREDLEGAAAEVGGCAEHELARGLAEWRMAAAAVRRMAEGNILVMGGPLDTWSGIGERLKTDALREASRRGVIVCGLSKTTALLMDSGRPLADHAVSCGPEGPWYVPLGDVWDGDGEYGTLVVRLHAASQYVYRLDINSYALARLGRDGTGRVLASLAANSADVHVPGYPYGLVDAYRWARVRADEAGRHHEQLRERLSHAVRESEAMQWQRHLLNEMTP